MSYVNGVNLLPGTGEFTYDTVAHLGIRPATESTLAPVNFHASGRSAENYGGEKTDFTISLDSLGREFPACTTVALIVSWFFDSRDAGTCNIYPSTTYINGDFRIWDGSTWIVDDWTVSGLTQRSAGLVAISSSGGKFTYGGTPSDRSVYNAIADLKSRGFRVVFYPFLLGDVPSDFPWRGRITHSPDKTAGAEAAVAAFLGSAMPSDFTQNTEDKTVSYRGGGSTDWTYRRMILHYAHLCAMAGGVDLFLIGSELRGLESIRGTGWTKAGMTGEDGKVTWDYPFVEAMRSLANDVRGILDAAGHFKNLATGKNLISYAADWSVWMGVQHAGEAGQWPHLDQLYGHANIDLVCFDNYMPLSDWTTETGGIDVLNWSKPKFTGSWPPDATEMNGLGLTGTPTIWSKDYFKANIEGGEKFHWYYPAPDGNLGRGFDPKGSGDQVSRPQGPRLAQDRSPFQPGQQLLANKLLRWWWNSDHRAVCDSGTSWAPQGGPTKWVPQSKSIAFTEYGFPSCDRATNQPNVFFDPKSSESFSPYWSVMVPAFGGDYLPRVDLMIAPLALQAIHEYWFIDGNNETSDSGVVMLDRAFCSVWAWDARPFPAFPKYDDVWGDTTNWPTGHWIDGKGPYFSPGKSEPPPRPGNYLVFPVLAGQAWSVRYTLTSTILKSSHVSGRESRAGRTSAPLLRIEIGFEVLRSGDLAELDALVGFYERCRGGVEPFVMDVPGALGSGAWIKARFAHDQLDLENFAARLWRGEPVRIQQVRGE
jgi:hypothetical protein